MQEDEEGAEGEGEPEAPTTPPPGPPPQLPSDDTRLESMDISSEGASGAGLGWGGHPWVGAGCGVPI